MLARLGSVLALLGTAACASAAARSESVVSQRLAARQAFSARVKPMCDYLRSPPITLAERVAVEGNAKLWSKAHPGAAHGRLRQAHIRRVIAAYTAKARECYSEALEGWPNAAGRISVRFVVGPSGGVEGAKVLSNETGVEPLECCVVAVAARSWRFDPPAGGGIVVVTHPFVFTAK